MDMQIVKPIAEQLNNTTAPAITYGSATVSLTLWGLHINEIAALIAALSALGGLILQVYVAMRRIRTLEKGLAANTKVTVAQAEATRTIDKKIEKLGGDK